MVDPPVLIHSILEKLHDKLSGPVTKSLGVLVVGLLMLLEKREFHPNIDLAQLFVLVVTFDSANIVLHHHALNDGSYLGPQ